MKLPAALLTVSVRGYSPTCYISISPISLLAKELLHASGRREASEMGSVRCSWRTSESYKFRSLVYVEKIMLRQLL